MIQTNQANTRIKKLKKLYNISSEIIRQFGLRYYLNVALEELSAQKGSIFAIEDQDVSQNDYSTVSLPKWKLR